ncbi:MAG: protein disulfide oxidoreductase [Methylococcales bacterium]|nr:protein disulfide oxidoreductase [Methylococcales bacterium]
MLKKYGFYLLAAAIIFGGQFLQTSNLVRGKPPLINGTTLDGIPAMPLIEKGPGFIYFWAEWCGICGMMQSAVSAAGLDYPQLTVALRSGADSAVAEYLHKKQLHWPVVNDPHGEIADRYGVKAVPALFFINADGNIVFTSVGFTSEWGLRIRAWLAGLI